MSKKLTIKEIRELAEKRNIHIPNYSMTKDKLLQYLKQEDIGKVISANQIREIAAFYNVPVRRSSATKTYLLNQLIKAGLINAKETFRDLKHKYDVIQINRKLITPINSQFNTQGLSTENLQELINQTPPDIRENLEKLRNYESTGEKPDIEYERLRESYGNMLSAIKRRSSGIRPEDIETFNNEIEIFNNEIAPVIKERMERLKELSAINLPDVFKTFNSKFVWENYKFKQRQDEVIAEKINDFIKTKRISFENLTDTARAELCPFLYDWCENYFNEATINVPLYVAMKFSDGQNKVYNVHNGHFRDVFLQYLKEKRFLYQDGIEIEGVFEISGVDANIILKNLTGFKIITEAEKALIKSIDKAEKEQRRILKISTPQPRNRRVIQEINDNPLELDDVQFEDLMNAKELSDGEKKKKKTNKVRGGDFFNYSLKNDFIEHEQVHKTLRRLQIYNEADFQFINTILSKPKPKKEWSDLDEEEEMKKKQDIKKQNEIIKELRHNCFIYALSQSNNKDVTDRVLMNLMLNYHYKFISAFKIQEIIDKYELNITIRSIDEDQNEYNHVCQKMKFKKSEAVKAKQEIVINLYQKHYFIDFRTNLTSYYVKHINELKPVDHNKYWHHNRLCITNEKVNYMTSANVVRTLLKLNCFKPLTFQDVRKISDIIEIKITDETPLEFDDKLGCELNKPPPFKVDINKITDDIVGGTCQNNHIYFADFEADVKSLTKDPKTNKERQIHIPYMLCLVNASNIERKTFIGPNCGKALLDFLTHKDIIYFHNLSYDFNFLARYGKLRMIRKMNKCLCAIVIYKGKKLYFKDSFVMIPDKLASFPSMFGLEKTKKELFPYKYYDSKLIKTSTGIINEAGELEDPPWETTQYKEFMENIDSIPNCRVSDNEFNMFLYAEFYCKQDVDILRRGFLKFREEIKASFDVDIVDKISISSVSEELFKKFVYYPNGNIYKIGGIVQKFCQQSIRGGRCMTANNESHHVIKPLIYIDANSLYPASLMRLYTVEGKPEVIYNLDYEELKNKSTAFIVEIEITGIEKHYNFPLLSAYDTVNNSPVLNWCDKEVMIGRKIILNDITLEDLINFQGVTFKIIRGYMWRGKKDYRIRDLIFQLFQTRKKYKNEINKLTGKKGNPLQTIYKLLLNNLYGKTIQKPIIKDVRFIRGRTNKMKYRIRNYEKIISYNKVAGSIDDNMDPLYMFEIHKNTANFYNNCLLGSHILAMSKRIMNEAMCLAEDKECHMYYQDTDSFFIDVDDLPKLEKAYEEKYNRILMGKDLGEFHEDFKSRDGKDEVKYASESLFIRKKLYCCKLLMKDGTTNITFRSKGISPKALEVAAQKRYPFLNIVDAIWELYKYIYNGGSVYVDLCNGGPMFKFDKNFTVKSLPSFSRRIQR
jgi:hypothetical protein